MRDAHSEKQSNRGPKTTGGPENNLGLGLAELVAAVAHHGYGLPPGMAVSLGRDVEVLVDAAVTKRINELPRHRREGPVRRN